MKLEADSGKFTACILLAVAVIVSGCVMQTPNETNSHQDANAITEEMNIEITEFTTDKEVYGSYEEVKMTIVAVSPEAIENAEINVAGINPYQHAYVDESRIVNLSMGENEITFSDKTPSCTSGCGGVYPGPYDITARISVNGTLLAEASLTITLVDD